jgi:hypothetical protein
MPPCTASPTNINTEITLPPFFLPETEICGKEGYRDHDDQVLLQ